MSFNWLNTDDYSINCLLLFDKLLIQKLVEDEFRNDAVFRNNMGIIFNAYPAIYWYFTESNSEDNKYYEEIKNTVPAISDEKKLKDAENYILDKLDWAVVYVYPEVMDKLNYITDWDPDELLSITDFKGKTVLDIGSGTGRLAFAAAPYAKNVYACEPVARLREYMQKRKKELKVDNVFIFDGFIEDIPFPDNMFDIVMSGHVWGDDFDSEYNEMKRVVKNGGMIIDCPGAEEVKIKLKDNIVNFGFDYAHSVTKSGGEIYRYWKKIEKT